jgi:hypothetical protein
MPGGALMQLVAYGAQDVYLTGEPKVTFFQTAYKRHTNFAMETVQQTVAGALTPGGLTSVTLSRSGDLIGDMYVVLQPTPASSSNLTSNNNVSDMCWVAERAFNSVELFIGGQSIDKHYQLWFRLYSEVFLNDTKKQNWGKLTSFASPNNNGTSTGYVYLPLIFFFNRNPGLYLPLVALQYHEVRIDFSISSQYANYFGNNPFAVWANYVYLDTVERAFLRQEAQRVPDRAGPVHQRQPRGHQHGEHAKRHASPVEPPRQRAHLVLSDSKCFIEPQFSVEFLVQRVERQRDCGRCQDGPGLLPDSRPRRLETRFCTLPDRSCRTCT